MTDNETNLTLLNVNQIVSLLSRAYIKLIKNGTPLKSFPSVMLWGPPGIGKSQGVREIAGNIQAKTGKKVSITDVRLLLFNPVDLRGIPTTNADKTLSVWLKPQIFQMDESEDVINILFLDEITAAPQSVQAAAYQITLDRVIGEHKLPENCIVIAAGNRVTDKSVAYRRQEHRDAGHHGPSGGAYRGAGRDLLGGAGGCGGAVPHQRRRIRGGEGRSPTKRRAACGSPAAKKFRCFSVKAAGRRVPAVFLLSNPAAGGILKAISHTEKRSDVYGSSGASGAGTGISFF